MECAVGDWPFTIFKINLELGIYPLFFLRSFTSEREGLLA